MWANDEIPGAKKFAPKIFGPKVLAWRRVTTVVYRLNYRIDINSTKSIVL